MEGTITLFGVLWIPLCKGMQSASKAALSVTRICVPGLAALAYALVPCSDAMAETDRFSTPKPSASRTELAEPITTGGPPPMKEIVVTAARFGAAKVKAESEFNEDEISTFGADDIQDLLGRLDPFIDPGDDAPVVLVNGEPVGFDTSVLSYPAEALDHVAVLPLEAAAEYGHPSGKRVVNLVLKKKFSSLHSTGGLTWATRGGQYGGNFSAGRVGISGPTRWNVQARITADSALRKSARNIPLPAGPFDRVGYISNPTGAEIDPALSHAIGHPATHAAIPPQAWNEPPTLKDFATTVGHLHPANPNEYETLLPSRRTVSFSAGATHPLGAFSASLGISANSSNVRGKRGLPMASVLIPAHSPWSPFGSDIVLTRPFAGEQALRNENSARSLGITLTLTGKVGDWQTNFSALYGRDWNASLLEQGVDLDQIQALINAGDPNFNPYGAWDERYLLSSRNRSSGESLAARFNVSRKVIDLPAGPMTTNLSLNVNRNQTRNRWSDSLRGPMLPYTSTRERADGQMSFNVPLARHAKGERSILGDLSFNLTVSGETASHGRLQKRYGGGINWSPSPVLQLRGTLDYIEMSPSFEQLDSPIVTLVSRIYDYTKEEMAEPAWSTGGNPDLERGRIENFALNATVRPFNTQDLSLNVAYSRRVAKGGVAAFPELTPAVEAAFPERITRDTAGHLVAVDARAINIAHAADSELATGFVLRWRPARSTERSASPTKPRNPMLATASLTHHWRLESEMLIRPGIPAIDRLGKDGGQARHMLSLQITAGTRGLGASWNANWTGPAHLRGATSARDFHFKPTMTHTLSMHVEPQHLIESLGDQPWARHLKISIDAQNLFNGYRRVTFSDDSVPAGYTRDEIDPLGRTVSLTVRKRF